MSNAVNAISTELYFFARLKANSKTFIEYSEPSIPTKTLLTFTLALPLPFDTVILRIDFSYVLHFLLTAYYLEFIK
jgi:hypothetical protein